MQLRTVALIGLSAIANVGCAAVLDGFAGVAQGFADMQAANTASTVRPPEIEDEETLPSTVSSRGVETDCDLRYRQMTDAHFAQHGATADYWRQRRQRAYDALRACRGRGGYATRRVTVSCPGHAEDGGWEGQECVSLFGSYCEASQRTREAERLYNDVPPNRCTSPGFAR